MSKAKFDPFWAEWWNRESVAFINLRLHVVWGLIFAWVGNNLCPFYGGAACPESPRRIHISSDARPATLILNCSGYDIEELDLQALNAAAETAEIAKDRAERRTWLEQRGYRVIDIAEADLQDDIEPVLASLAQQMTQAASS